MVVNDLGGALDGTGGNSAASEKVVAEIKAAGGEAIANGASISDDAGVAHLVKQTMDAFGRIDVLVANAGILRDRSFGKMELKDFEAVLSGWASGLFVDPIELWHSDTKDRSYEFNFCSYSNPVADELMVAAHAPTRVRGRWAAETLVSFVFEALLHWIEDGDPAHDDEFLARVDASLPALVAAWASVTPA